MNKSKSYVSLFAVVAVLFTVGFIPYMTQADREVVKEQRDADNEVMKEQRDADREVMKEQRDAAVEYGINRILTRG